MRRPSATGLCPTTLDNGISAGSQTLSHPRLKWETRGTNSSSVKSYVKWLKACVNWLPSLTQPVLELNFMQHPVPLAKRCPVTTWRWATQPREQSAPRL